MIQYVGYIQRFSCNRASSKKRVTLTVNLNFNWHEMSFIPAFPQCATLFLKSAPLLSYTVHVDVYIDIFTYAFFLIMLFSLTSSYSQEQCAFVLLLTISVSCYGEGSLHAFMLHSASRSFFEWIHTSIEIYHSAQNHASHEHLLLLWFPYVWFIFIPLIYQTIHFLLHVFSRKSPTKA